MTTWAPGGPNQVSCTNMTVRVPDAPTPRADIAVPPTAGHDREHSGLPLASRQGSKEYHEDEERTAQKHRKESSESTSSAIGLPDPSHDAAAYRHQQFVR